MNINRSAKPTRDQIKKAKLELEKLASDKELPERQLKNYRKQQLLDLLKTLIPAITTIVAMLGI